MTGIPAAEASRKLGIRLPSARTSNGGSTLAQQLERASAQAQESSETSESAVSPEPAQFHPEPGSERVMPIEVAVETDATAEEVRPGPARVADLSTREVEGAVLAGVGAEEAESRAPARRGLLETLFGGGRSMGAHTAEVAAPEFDFDERMIDAMRIAERSARGRSIKRCWRFVKQALLRAEAIECYPRTAYAKQAAVELPQRYGFKRLPVTDPHAAPVGSVLVYGGRGAGHVEFRTEDGFVSDHASATPSSRPLIGVFVKPRDG